MPEEDEWFYGADLRFEGRQVPRGALRADQLTLEAEAAGACGASRRTSRPSSRRSRSVWRRLFVLVPSLGSDAPVAAPPDAVAAALTALQPAGDDRRGAGRSRLSSKN